MQTRIKICGITNIEDAEIATKSGADALGFIFVPETPRYIKPIDAAEIINSLPPFVTTVGVFKDAEISAVENISGQTGINYVQLHGSESPEYCNQLFLPVMKVFELQNETDINNLDRYDVSASLIDKPKSVTDGTANWQLALKAKKRTHQLILAGGLTVENIADAIRYVQPYAVDVASGVEAEKRKKDPKKISTFIKNVREIDTELAINKNWGRGNIGNNYINL